MKKYFLIFLIILIFLNVEVAFSYPSIPIQGMLGAANCSNLTNPAVPGYPTNLVGYWQFNGTIGAITNGASLPALVSSAGTAANAGGTYSYVAGPKVSLNQGITCSAANSTDYISLGNSAGINDLATTTWMFWIMPNAAATANMTVLYKSDGNGSAGWFIYLKYNSATAPQYQVCIKTVYSGTDMNLCSNPVVTVGSWSHIALTWDGTTGGCTGASPHSCTGVHIYANGVETSYWWSAVPAGSHTTDAAQVLYVGHDGGGASGQLYGSMDEVAIWNVVLTSTQVSTVYSRQTCY